MTEKLRLSLCGKIMNLLLIYLQPIEGRSAMTALSLLKEVLSRVSDLWSMRINCAFTFCRLGAAFAFAALSRVGGNVGGVLGVGV